MTDTENLPDYRVVADSRVLETRPLFSVTVAVYDVEEYIGSTLKSFKRQDIAPELVEYIIVDDGSPDNAVDTAAEFAGKHPNVLVITKPNGGVGETRQLALSLARGEWVTAVDPDDLIRFDYFSEAKRFLDADTEGKISILSSRVLITNGADGTYRDTHPLGAKFRGGNRIVSMLEEPSAIQMGATAFLKLDVLREHGLTFKTNIKPTFEDGNLVCRYLAHFEEPVVALLSTSHYYYRKRADSSSLVQSSWLKPERYAVVPKQGYLDALEYAYERLGCIPDWLANVVLYDLMWYFKEDEKMGSVVASIAPELKREFLDAAEQIFAYLSCEQILKQALNKPSWRLRESLLRRFNLDQSAARIFRWGLREDGQRNYTLLTSPGEHQIEVYSAGKRIEVIPEGLTQRIYFDEVFVSEYTFALPEAPTYFVVDGQHLTTVQKLTPDEAGEPNEYLLALTEQIRGSMPVHTRRQKIWQRWLVAAGIQNVPLWGVAWQKVRANCQRLLQKRRPNQGELTRKDVESYLETDGTERFRDAWLLLDHKDRADDNAEHLYRYLLNNEPDINAYFLLEKTSKDWDRLAAEGFRLLEYGSVEAMAAARCAVMVASSDAVEECIYPAPRRIFGAPDYQFVFLQHGITKDDISRWLNGKKIDLVVSATVDEYKSFTWENSPYEYKFYNSALTGFPRYDNLVKLDQQRTQSEEEPYTIFIMPTWRQSLRDAIQEVEDEQERVAILKESSFYQHWWAFLTDERLTALIEQGRVRVRFLAHPSFGNLLDLVERPAGIEFLAPSEISFQGEIVDSDIFLTDYSSLAFDCAYIGRPLAYFQFDREEMFSGGHTYRQGYFDYFRDGLGPVIEDSENLINWVFETLESQCEYDKLYESKRSSTYQYLDGNNCQRTASVMKAMVADNWPLADSEYILLPERKL